MSRLLTAVNRVSLRLIADIKTRDALTAVVDNIAVRNGEIGDGEQAFLTTGDLTDGGYKAEKVANAMARALANSADKSGSPMFSLADKLRDRIIASPEWQSLFQRIGLLDAPDTTPGSLAYQMLAEARRRGAAITTVTEAIQKESESRASEVKLITAALDDNAAAIKTVSEAVVTVDEAIARRIDTLASAVGDNAAAIQDEAETRADEVSAQANRITTLVSETKDSIGGIESKLSTKTNNDNALVEAVNTIWAKVGSVNALVKSGDEIAVNQTGSVITKFDQLQAVVTDPVTGLVDKSAALRQEFNVTNSRIDGMRGTWSMKLDLNGYVSGMSLNATTNTEGVSRSNVLFNVDTFAVGAPGRPYEVPFAIDARTGLVGIRGDLVVRGSITSYQLAAQSVERDKLALKVIGGAQIDDLAVDTLKLANQSVTTMEQFTDWISGRANENNTGSKYFTSSFYMAHPGDAYLICTSQFWSTSPSADWTTATVDVDGGQVGSIERWDASVQSPNVIIGKVALGRGWHTVTVFNQWKNLEPMNQWVNTTAVIVFRAYK